MLTLVGAVEIASAIATLFIYVLSTWDASSQLDRVLQAALLGSAAAGVFLYSVGAESLHFRIRVSRGFRARRASAATSP